MFIELKKSDCDNDRYCQMPTSCTLHIVTPPAAHTTTKNRAAHKVQNIKKTVRQLCHAASSGDHYSRREKKAANKSQSDLLLFIKPLPNARAAFIIPNGKQHNVAPLNTLTLAHSKRANEGRRKMMIVVERRPIRLESVAGERKNPSNPVNANVFVLHER